jgi:hypothetical protein
MVKAILGCLLGLCLSPAAQGTESEYRVKFFHIPIGRASFQQRHDGSGRVELLVRSRTNFVGSLIYSVNNTYTTSVDVSTGWPLQMVKMIAEKSVRETTTVTYDELRKRVSYGDRGGFDVPAGIHNFFSALAQLRRIGRSKPTEEFLLMAHGKLWRAGNRKGAGKGGR